MLDLIRTYQLDIMLFLSCIYAALTGDQCALTDIRVVSFSCGKKGDAAGDQ